MSENQGHSAGESLEAALRRLDQERRLMPRHGPGRFPAVIVVDMQAYFLKEGTPDCDNSIVAIERLVGEARRSGAPIVFVRVVFDDRSEITPCWRERGLPEIPLMRGMPTVELHEGLGYRPGDLVIEKKHASGFAGTTLHDRLSALGVDTLLVTGTATSGCVRATAVDGAALHYRVLVVEECTYEHRPISGTVALSEMADRYADVVSLSEAVAYLRDLVPSSKAGVG